MSGMRVWRAETAQIEGCSQEHSRYEVIALGRAHNLSEWDILWPLSHTGHKGTAEEGIRLY